MRTCGVIDACVHEARPPRRHPSHRHHQPARCWRTRRLARTGAPTGRGEPPAAGLVAARAERGRHGAAGWSPRPRRPGPGGWSAARTSPSTSDLGWLAAVAARVDTRAVLYLRRQDHWVMSWDNQHVKWPFDRTKSQDRSRRVPRHARGLPLARLRAAAQTLERGARAGPGRVAVLERGQVEDATADFLARLGDRRGRPRARRRAGQRQPAGAHARDRPPPRPSRAEGRQAPAGAERAPRRPRRPGAGRRSRPSIRRPSATPGARPLRGREPRGGAALPRARGAVPRAAARTGRAVLALP